MTFIKEQQELAKNYNNTIGENGKRYVAEEYLDTLITQIITNIGEELLRRAEGEKLTEKSIPASEYDAGYTKGNRHAIDTMKQHITSVTGVE